MKIAYLSILFPPKFGGIMQSAGVFYTMHEKMFGRPPYLVYTFNPELKWQHTKGIYRIKYPTLKITARSFIFFTMYLKDVIKLNLSNGKQSGMKKIVNIARWFLNPRNILRPLVSCYYADVLLRGKFKPDIMLVMTTRIMGTVAAIAKKLMNVPVVTICHGEDIIRPSPELVFNLHYSDGIITRTKAIQDLFRARYDASNKKFALIPDAIAEEDYAIEKSKVDLRSELQIPENEFAVISAGNMVRRKNFDNVIRALWRIKRDGIIDENRPIHAYIIGDGEEFENLQKLTSHMQLNDEVGFMGRIPNELRNKYLKASDLFIMTPFDMPDSIEGFGIVYIEANYYEVPAIGSNSGGVPEAVLDGKTGFIINQKDPAQLAKKIETLYFDEAMRQDFGRQGKERILSEFMAPSIFNKYIRFLKTIARN